MYIGWFNLALIALIAIYAFREFELSESSLKRRIEDLELEKEQLCNRLAIIEHDMRRVQKALPRKQETIEEQIWREEREAAASEQS